ncbi:MAG: hypothetical protein IJO32_02320 [Bacilli bacterium]|nr:hypothetical protein [Bacilli bacterium]
MAIYDNLNIETLVKEYYGKDSTQNEIIINKRNTTFCTSKVNDYFEEVKKYPKLSVEEQQKYITEYLNGNKEAKQILINSKLYYVFLVALGYIGNGINLEDLIQEGNIGLIKAVNSLNNSNKNNFTFQINCYVNYYINSFIEKNSNKQITKHMTSNQSIRMIKYYKNQILKDSNIEKICDELDITNSETIEPINNSISLNINLEDNSELGEIVPNDKYNPEIILLKEEHDLFPIINNSNLTERQKQYIIVRCGLFDNVFKSKRVTAKLFNVSPQSINCIHKSVVKKLKVNKQFIELYNSVYHNHIEYEILNTEKEEYSKQMKKRHLLNKGKMWLYIKKYIYTFFSHHSKSQIDNALSTLSKDEIKTIENLVKDKDASLKQEFFNILDKLSNILDKENYHSLDKKERNIKNLLNTESIIDLKYAKEKINAAYDFIKKLEILNNIKENPSNRKEYSIKISYKTHKDEYNGLYYTYNIRIDEKDIDKINILLNLNLNFKKCADGLNTITDFIKKINENSQTILTTFDKSGNSVINNNSNIKITTQINNIEENNKFVLLHKYLKENAKKNKTKIKK